MNTESTTYKLSNRWVSGLRKFIVAKKYYLAYIIKVWQALIKLRWLSTIPTFPVSAFPILITLIRIAGLFRWNLSIFFFVKFLKIQNLSTTRHPRSKVTNAIFKGRFQRWMSFSRLEITTSIVEIGVIKGLLRKLIENSASRSKQNTQPTPSLLLNRYLGSSFPSTNRNKWTGKSYLPLSWQTDQGRLLTAQVRNFFVFSIFDDHAVLCAVKSDKQKFKDKAFINRWSASQIKHITAKSNSRLIQKILFDVDYQSFEVGESLFVSRCRRSRWRFFCNEYLASTLSIHFWAV